MRFAWVGLAIICTWFLVPLVRYECPEWLVMAFMALSLACADYAGYERRITDERNGLHR